MDVSIFAGKGGVGKSTLAGAYAMSLSQQRDPKKVLLIDQDGGHSLARVFHFEHNGLKPNLINDSGLSNLSLSVIKPLPFKPVSRVKIEQGDIEHDYLPQFRGDQGLVAWADMMQTFFGVPTDTSMVSGFLYVNELLHAAADQKFDQVIIDVEPTAGLERLLNGTNDTARSIHNLGEYGTAMLFVIGAKWPDVATFLAGEYIDRADHYADRMRSAANMVRSASYYLVTVPKSSPVDQLGDVRSILQSHGASIKGFAINDVRDEKHEGEQINRVYGMANGHPVVLAKHDPRLCAMTREHRHIALRDLGDSLVASYH